MSVREAIILGIFFSLVFLWGRRGWKRFRDNLEDYWAMRDDLVEANRKLLWYFENYGSDSGAWGCGYACGIVHPYGWVPEDGCPVHDSDVVILEDENAPNLSADQ